MIDAAGEALVAMLSVERLWYILLGTLLGFVVGTLPGLGGIVGMSLLLPFIFGMDVHNGVALMMGMIAVVHTADTFSSVLLGAPGSAGSQATIMDGFPMAQNGEAARALGAAFGASLLGGIVGAIVLFSLLSVARPLVLALTSPRLFSLGILGLTTVGVLVRGRPIPGLLSALIGVFIGLIGGAIGAPVYRYTFGQIYLYDGLPIAITALAIFALPELTKVLREGGSISRRPTVSGGIATGLRDVGKNLPLVGGSASVGTAIGMVPGIGASVVDWVAYSLAQQFSRNSQEFGRGDVRGVIAPESANNAKEGGALVPTLLFGIPGTAVSAMLMGGLILLGIQVGPSMVTTDLPVTLTILWTLPIANIFGALLCIAMVTPIARLTSVNAAILAPYLAVIIVLAAYQSTFLWPDILWLVALAILGYLMLIGGWPRAPLIIGVVLSVNIERYLSISIGRYGASWMVDPFVIVVFVACLSMVITSSIRAKRDGQGESLAESFM